MEAEVFVVHCASLNPSNSVSAASEESSPHGDSMEHYLVVEDINI
jgi:hypothetical protein